MQNLKEPSKRTLIEILRGLKQGKYIIPDFQRDFDWQAYDIKELIKSIFSNYYIGNLLLWKSYGNNKELLDCQDVHAFDDSKTADIEYIVLDGQQRLTSLYYAFCKPNKPLKNKSSIPRFFIDIKKLLDENYEEAIIYKWFSSELAKYNDEEYQMEQDIFPLDKISEDDFNYYREEWLRVYRQKKENLGTRFRNALVNTIDKYNIPFIELEEEIELNRVCDIFEKINSRGKKLDTFDLLNSLLKKNDIRLRSELWSNAQNELEHILDDSTKMYLLQTMSIIKQAYCSPKYLYYLVPQSVKVISEEGQRRNIVLINDSDEFLELWNEAFESVKQGASLLYDSSRNGYGVTKKQYLPYNSIIHIFSALNRYLSNDKNLNNAVNRAKVRRWYFASIITEQYSSSVDSTAAKDYEDMKAWFVNDSKQPEVINEAIKVIDDLESSDRLEKLDRAGSALYKVILNLIVLRGANDFYTGEAPTLNILDDHHIVPKSKANALNVSNINSILNRTLISQATNQSINASSPREYIAKVIDNCGGRDKALEVFSSHFISPSAVGILEREDFSSDDYNEFINERKNSIIEYIKRTVL